MISANYGKAFQFRSLLKSNRELLQQKNSYSPGSLLELIKRDYEKVLLGLAEVKSRRVAAILQHFFDGHEHLLRLLYPVVEMEQLFHVGFEVYEPMDLVVEGFEYWSRKFERMLATEIQVTRYLRFPASAAFQKRVSSPAEIMRIWMWVGGQELMLELFDIHRPVRRVLSRTPSRFSALDLRPRLAAPGLPPDHDEVLRHHFGDDPIWHYAIAVKEAQAVETLHATLQQFVGRTSGFQLAYPACVRNQHDGSYHTKIINTTKHLELEFVHHVTFVA